MKKLHQDDAIKQALAPFGWECGPEFDRRYYTDPWVFNLTNAVVKLSGEVKRLTLALGARNTEAELIWMEENQGLKDQARVAEEMSRAWRQRAERAEERLIAIYEIASKQA